MELAKAFTAMDMILGRKIELGIAKRMLEQQQGKKDGITNENCFY